MPGGERLRDLGDGLILRRATAGDAEALADLNGEVFRDGPSSGPNRGIATWTREIAGGAHPTIRARDFTIVEDTGADQIVSSLCLISQTWTYGGIPFGVGRVELVGTRPEYRRRGLIRAQFDEVHRWSAERGELAQAITGIPNFYRQFGYEMTIDLHGGNIAYAADIPPLKDGEGEAYRVRPAEDGDVRFLMETSRAVAGRHGLATVRDEVMWRYEIAGRGPESGTYRKIAIVQTLDGRAVGFLSYQPNLWDNGKLGVDAYELASGVSWLAVTPTVLRYLQSAAEASAAQSGKPFRALHFRNGADHPVARAFPEVLTRLSQPYAWYVRVPDLAAFLNHVAPVLESRLADSLAPGHTGDLFLSLYRDVLRLGFVDGKLQAVTHVPPWESGRIDAAFPGLTFLQLLFGHRSIDELRRTFPDCWGGSEARVLLDALFPKQIPFLLPIE